MHLFYAMLNETHRDIKTPAYILERVSVDPPVDRLHYRDGNSHSSPSFRNGIPIGPDCVEISEEEAGRILAHWKEVWFTENKDLYSRRDEALARQAVTYYAVLGMVYPANKMDPDGILRRVHISPTHTLDERLYPDRMWQPTEFFRLYRLGHIDDDYEELTIAEAEEAILKWPENLQVRWQKTS